MQRQPLNIWLLQGVVAQAAVLRPVVVAAAGIRLQQVFL
jgi:hypothetical protein